VNVAAQSALTISDGEAVLFWVLAPLAVLGALALLFARRTVHIAVSIAGVMVALAIFYTMLEAPFLGVAQVVVYTGAVMMLFLFVIMLVGVDSSESLVETLAGQRWIAVLGGLGLVSLLTGVVVSADLPAGEGLAVANADTNPVGVARLIFGDFVLTFELTGALLITAALGALVLTHRQRLAKKVGQRELADAKLAAFGRGAGSAAVTPSPAPGVYARHNSADMPALDPSGEPVEQSVPTVLRVRGQDADLTDVDAERVRRITSGPAPDAPPAPEAPQEPESPQAPETKEIHR
jgi:NADH-quinone oxidoreductase subunit J